MLHHLIRRTPARLPTTRIAPTLRTPGFHRHASAAAAPVVSSAAAAAKPFPDKVLIYFAGKRSIFLGTLKLYGVLLFAYNTLIVAPSLLRGGDSIPDAAPPAEDQRGWLKRQGSVVVAKTRELLGVGLLWEKYLLAALVVAGAAVPLAFVGYTSPPYVTHIRLALPPWARSSAQHLSKFLKSTPLPKETEVELVTMRWYGRPKVTSAKLGELLMTRERWGCVNTVADNGRKGRFYVDWKGSPAKVVVQDGLAALERSILALQGGGTTKEEEVLVKVGLEEALREEVKKMGGKGVRRITSGRP